MASIGYEGERGELKRILFRNAKGQQKTLRLRRQQIRQHKRAKAIPRRPKPKHKTPRILRIWWGLASGVIPWKLD